MVLEAVVVAVVSWVVKKILDSLNRDIEGINSNYYKTETSYNVVVNNYTRVINTYNWDSLWKAKKIIINEYDSQWKAYKKMIGLQHRLHESKQDLYDKTKSSNSDKQTRQDAHNIIQELKTREKDIVIMMRNTKERIDETKRKIHAIKNEIEDIKRRNSNRYLS
ncbi:MAG: hypothetical protein PVH88_27185 [Ignavibacteria bacterium]|jgi:hypothetical protein